MSGERPIPNEVITQNDQTAETKSQATDERITRLIETRPHEVAGALTNTLTEKIRTVIAGNTEAIKIFDENSDLRKITEEVEDIMQNAEYEDLLTTRVPEEPTYSFASDVRQKLRSCCTSEQSVLAKLQEERNRFNRAMSQELVSPLKIIGRTLEAGYEEFSQANKEQEIPKEKVDGYTESVLNLAKIADGIVINEANNLVTIENNIIEDLDGAVATLTGVARAINDLNDALKHEQTNDVDETIKTELQQKLQNLEERIRKTIGKVQESSDQQQRNKGSLHNTAMNESELFRNTILAYVE